MMIGTLFLLGLLFATLNGVYSESVSAEGPCDRLEKVICGDSRARYMIKYCQPSDEGLKRILSINLDTSQPHRYCSDPGKYAISPDGTKFWVLNFCYGTFDVCLELDDEYKFEETATNATNTEESTTEATGKSNDSKGDEGTSDTTVQPNLSDTTDEMFTADGIATDEHLTNGRDEANQRPFPDDATGGMNNNSSPTTLTDAPGQFVSKSKKEMDPVLKVILMAGVVAGGFVLILLIVLTAYLIHSCNRKNQDRRSTPRSYGPKLSTSALVSSEVLNDDAVYASIPYDRTNPRPLTAPPTSTYRQKRQPYEPAQRPQTDGNDAIRHEYYKLNPEVCHFCAPRINNNNNEGGIYSRVQTDGVYDRLVSAPRQSVSDCAMYSHLGTFTRERKKTEDMSTQTELDELQG